MSVERKTAFAYRGKKSTLPERRKVAKVAFRKNVIPEQLKNDLIRIFRKAGGTTDLSGKYVVSIEKQGSRKHYEAREPRFRLGGLYSFVSLNYDEKRTVVSELSESLKIPEGVLYEKLFSRSQRSFEWEGEILQGLKECMLKAGVMALEAQLPEDFNHLEWLGKWLVSPQPALNGRAPIEMMRTSHGIDQVKNLLDAMRYGVYL